MLDNIAPASLLYGAGNGPGNGRSRPGTGSRACPVTGCDAVISSARLMCRRHWYHVPKPSRDRVWATWRSGTGVFTPAHRQAVSSALATASAAQRKQFPAA
jgi:hypothetical protein